MTVLQLIRCLERMPPNHDVLMEGCDCYQKPKACVSIPLSGGRVVLIVNQDSDREIKVWSPDKAASNEPK